MRNYVKQQKQALGFHRAKVILGVFLSSWQRANLRRMRANRDLPQPGGEHELLVLAAEKERAERLARLTATARRFRKFRRKAKKAGLDLQTYLIQEAKRAQAEGRRSPPLPWEEQ